MKRIRLSLDIEPEIKDRLEWLKHQSKLSSITEVVRRALALFHMVLDNQAQGGKLIFEDKDGNQETVKLL